MYEFVKHFWHATYECAWKPTDIYISNMEEVMEKYKYDYVEILDCLVFAKESERLAAGS